MQNLEEIKNRFLENDLDVRLGCIASDLGRIESFSKTLNRKDRVISDLIEETKLFIEWTATNASLKVQEELVTLQIRLAVLETTAKELKELTKVCGEWSKKILALSGLLSDADKSF